jgi:hypothetical protein
MARIATNNTTQIHHSPVRFRFRDAVSPRPGATVVGKISDTFFGRSIAVVVVAVVAEISDMFFGRSIVVVVVAVVAVAHVAVDTLVAVLVAVVVVRVLLVVVVLVRVAVRLQ